MENKEYDYPVNVLVDFSEPELSEGEIEKLKADKDLLEKWDNTISRPPFNERFKPMLEMFYRDGHSLNKIGELFGVTGQRVRQILRRDLVNIIQKNKDNVRALFMEGTGEYDRKREELIIKRNEEYRKSLRMKNNEEKAEQHPIKEEPFQDTIMKLDLDPKLFELLCRTGIKTFDDIKKCDPVEFENNNYMDKKTLSEFLKLMKSFGVEYDEGYFSEKRGIGKQKTQKTVPFPK